MNGNMRTQVTSQIMQSYQVWIITDNEGLWIIRILIFCFSLFPTEKQGYIIAWHMETSHTYYTCKSMNHFTHLTPIQIGRCGKLQPSSWTNFTFSKLVKAYIKYMYRVLSDYEGCECFHFAKSAWKFFRYSFQPSLLFAPRNGQKKREKILFT